MTQNEFIAASKTLTVIGCSAVLSGLFRRSALLRAGFPYMFGRARVRNNVRRTALTLDHDDGEHDDDSGQHDPDDDVSGADRRDDDHAISPAQR